MLYAMVDTITYDALNWNGNSSASSMGTGALRLRGGAKATGERCEIGGGVTSAHAKRGRHRL